MKLFKMTRINASIYLLMFLFNIGVGMFALVTVFNVQKNVDVEIAKDNLSRYCTKTIVLNKDYYIINRSVVEEYDLEDEIDLLYEETDAVIEIMEVR